MSALLPKADIYKRDWHVRWARSGHFGYSIISPVRGYSDRVFAVLRWIRTALLASHERTHMIPLRVIYWFAKQLATGLPAGRSYYRPRLESLAPIVTHAAPGRLGCNMLTRLPSVSKNET